MTPDEVEQIVGNIVSVTMTTTPDGQDILAPLVKAGVLKGLEISQQEAIKRSVDIYYIEWLDKTIAEVKGG